MRNDHRFKCEVRYMGLVNAKIVIKNPRKLSLKPIEADALVHSGVVRLFITEHIRIQLELDELKWCVRRTLH